MALRAQTSAKLDTVVEIARPQVADPEDDGIAYSVRDPDGELVEHWTVWVHYIDPSQPDVIRLAYGLDDPLEQFFEDRRRGPIEGVFPARNPNRLWTGR